MCLEEFQRKIFCKDSATAGFFSASVPFTLLSPVLHVTNDSEAVNICGDFALCRQALCNVFSFTVLMTLPRHNHKNINTTVSV